MKKLLLLILSLFVINVINAEDVLYDTGSLSINFDGTTLSLNSYSNDDSGSSFIVPSDMSYFYNDGSYDFSIYTDGDLNLDLTGENTLLGAGLGVEGDLVITGSGSLKTDLLIVDGDISTTCNIVLNNGTNSYLGPDLTGSYYVYYLDGGVKEAPYYNMGTYYKTDLSDITDSIYIEVNSSTPMANIDNLYTSSDVYNYNTTKSSWEVLENVDGFIIYETGVGTKVSYDPSSLTYTVEFFDDLSGGVVKPHYFELAYNSSEFGKDVSYKILQATNAFELTNDGSNYVWKDFVINNEYKQDNGLVGDRTKYSLTEGGTGEIGTAFYEFGVKKDNYISIKVLGENNTYRIINLKVTNNGKEEEKDSDKQVISSTLHEVPNTCVK